MTPHAAWLLVGMMTMSGFTLTTRAQQTEPRVIRHGACAVDPQILTLPPCALETRNGETFVSRKYLPLFFGVHADALGSAGKGTNGFAYSAVAGQGWVYFDHTGRIVVRNVATMDNGPNAFHHGLVRIMRDGKWGLVDVRGKIVTPLTYDGMLDYQDGKGWLACSACHEETGPDGEYKWFNGGTWIWLDRRGRLMGKAQEPPTPEPGARSPGP
jgi:WG containing repeat